MRIVTIDDSSHISQMSYDVDTQVMHVRFVSGMVYRYDKVNPSIFAVVVSADSIGVAFNELVKFNSSIPYMAVDDMPEVKNAAV